MLNRRLLQVIQDVKYSVGAILINIQVVESIVHVLHIIFIYKTVGDFCSFLIQREL